MSGGRVFEVPEAVRARAAATGQEGWLEGLPDLVEGIAGEWGLRVGGVLSGGSAALVLEVEDEAGTPLVLKLHLPEDGASAASEMVALRLAGGQGCARVYRGDAERETLLLERLGAPLFDRELGATEREEILVATVRPMWGAASASELRAAGLMTGAEKGRWLIEAIERMWRALGEPCPRETVEFAVGCAGRRIAGHREERAVLVHGDAHELNALAAGDGYRLVDPDGLWAEPEYDVGVILREQPPDRGAGEVRARAEHLGSELGLDGRAIWEWACVERVSTGLHLLELGFEDEGQRYLVGATGMAELGSEPRGGARRLE